MRQREANNDMASHKAIDLIDGTKPMKLKEEDKENDEKEFGLIRSNRCINVCRRI